MLSVSHPHVPFSLNPWLFGLFVVGSVSLFPVIHPKSKRIFQPLLPHPTAGDAQFQVIVRGLHRTGGGGPLLVLQSCF